MNISGAQLNAVPPLLLKLLQILSGYLFLRWLGWLAARYLFGYRVDATLSIVGERLLYQARVFLMGRKIREVEEVFLVRDVVSLGVDTRFPHLTLLMGTAGLLLGAMYGLTTFVDGLQAGYLAISLVGLSLLLAGILLDVAFGALYGFIGARSALIFTLRRSTGGMALKRFRLLGVDSELARGFVERVIAS